LDRLVREPRGIIAARFQVKGSSFGIAQKPVVLIRSGLPVIRELSDSFWE
jgi:hypothetical protein